MTGTVARRPRDAEQELADIEARHGQYSLRLVWDPDDRIYVATVPELPGCRTHGATAVEAATKARDAIVTWLIAALHWGDAIPLPAMERHAVEDQPPTASAALLQRDGGSGTKPALYRRGMVRKAQALKVAVDHGLQSPLGRG